MDIPPGLVSLSHYRASLGHKVLLEKFKSLKFKLWFIYFHFQYFKLIFFIENFKSQKSKVWHINNKKIETLSGGQLLEIRLLDNHLLDTFGRKSIARHKIYQLLESG
jgi:hypothetical protein